MNQRADELRRMYREGASVAAIKDALGYSSDKTTRAALRCNGLYVSGRRNARNAAIAKLAKTGAKHVDIALSAGISTSHVYRILERMKG